MLRLLIEFFNLIKKRHLPCVLFKIFTSDVDVEICSFGSLDITVSCVFVLIEVFWTDRAQKRVKANMLMGFLDYLSASHTFLNGSYDFLVSLKVDQTFAILALLQEIYQHS